jgi:hypothetical protein
MEQIEETDIVLRCVDCGASYVLSVGERKFYDGRGLHLPRRCPLCRARRRQEGEAQTNSQGVQR